MLSEIHAWWSPICRDEDGVEVQEVALPAEGAHREVEVQEVLERAILLVVDRHRHLGPVHELIIELDLDVLALFGVRSEERRVGKECRCRWGRDEERRTQRRAERRGEEREEGGEHAR